MIRAVILLAALLPAVAAGAPAGSIGSKNFTESVLLGEMLRLQAQSQGTVLEHRRALGGTAILWHALLDGRIDAYPEYTGTLLRELLADLPADAGAPALAERLQRLGVGISAPLGFEDGYALTILSSAAKRLQLARLSDLARVPGVRFGLSNEFLERGDGWPRLRQALHPPLAQVRGIDHDLGYRALAAGDIDVLDGYSTDAEIDYYHLRVLTDDRGLFPRYDAVWLYRLDASRRVPGLRQAIAALEGRIDAQAMRALNARVKLGGESETTVAATFLGQAAPAQETRGERIARRTREHLVLVGVSLALAVLLGLPLGVFAAHRPRARHAALGLCSVLQTVPSLAMLVFLIPWLGIGAKPAIAALFLYSLLPIVRNTITGLDGIERDLRLAAQALALRPRTTLLRIELPLAAPSILAGISTAAVINIGTATLGALVGAGGYGQPILTGVRLDDAGLILEGAIPAAALALLAQAAFQGIAWLATPRGLRARGRAAAE